MTGIGAGGGTAMLKALHEQQGELTAHARSALHGLAAQMWALDSEIDRLEAQLLERKPAKIATVALTNKTARIAWGVMSRKEVCAAPAA